MSDKTQSFGALEAQTTEENTTTESLESFGVETDESGETRIDSPTKNEFVDGRPDETTPDAGDQAPLIESDDENQQTLSGNSAANTSRFEDNRGDDSSSPTLDEAHGPTMKRPIPEKERARVFPALGAFDVAPIDERELAGTPVAPDDIQLARVNTNTGLHYDDYAETRQERREFEEAVEAFEAPDETAETRRNPVEKAEKCTHPSTSELVETDQYGNPGTKHICDECNFTVRKHTGTNREHCPECETDDGADTGEGVATDGGRPVDEHDRLCAKTETESSATIRLVGRDMPDGWVESVEIVGDDGTVTTLSEGTGLEPTQTYNRVVDPFTNEDGEEIDRGAGVATDGGRDRPELETDVNDREISDECTDMMNELAEETNCGRVLCHWHESERVGYWSKDDVVKGRVVEIAEEHGWTVDMFSVRYFHEAEKNVGAVELIPDGEEVDRGEGIETDGGRSRPAPDSPELLEAIGREGGRIPVLRAIEGFDSLGVMDAVEVADHNLNAETATIDETAAAFVRDWNEWVTDSWTVERAVSWAVWVEAEHGDEADQYARDYGPQSDGVDRGAGIETDGGRELPSSEPIQLITGITGVMHSPSIVEAETSGSGKTMKATDSTGEKSVRLDTEKILSGESEFRGSTYWEIYTPGRLRAAQRSNNAPGPQAGANGVSDADDLPTPTHWPRTEQPDDVPDECPNCGAVEAPFQVKNMQSPRCEACGVTVDDAQEDESDDGDDDPEKDALDMQTWDRADVIAVEGFGELLITRLRQTRTQPPTTTGAEAVDRTGDEHKIRTFDRMDAPELVVDSDTGESAVSRMKGKRDFSADEVAVVGRDMDWLRDYIRGKWDGEGDGDDRDGGGGGDDDRPDNSGDTPTIVTDGGSDQANLSEFATDDAGADRGDGIETDGGRELSEYEGAEVFEDGEKVAEITEVVEELGRTRFKTMHDGTLYNGIASNVLENIESDGLEIRFPDDADVFELIAEYSDHREFVDEFATRSEANQARRDWTPEYGAEEPVGLTVRKKPDESEGADRGEGIETDGGETPLEAVERVDEHLHSRVHPKATLRTQGGDRAVKLDPIRSELPSDVADAGIVRAARFVVVDESVRGVIGETADGRLFNLRRRNGAVCVQPAGLAAPFIETPGASTPTTDDGRRRARTDGGRL